MLNSGFKPALGPDLSKSTDGPIAWFGPIDAPEIRFRYAVISDEGTTISILPGDARFKKGLTALRWPAKEGGEPITYLVTKTKPNRIDLERA